MNYRILALALLSRLSFLAVSGQTTVQNFVGYYDYNGVWTTFTCGPGLTFTTTENTGTPYAGCIPTSPTGSLIAEYCESTSLRVVTPGITYPCPSPTTACVTILIYSNLDLGTPTTLLDCLTAEIAPVSMFRETTSSNPSAPATSSYSTATSTPSVTSSTGTGSTQSSSTYSTPPTSTGSTSISASSSTSSQLSSSSSNNGSSNHKSEAIGLGTGLGLGLPIVLIALLAAWLFTRYRRALRERDNIGRNGTPMPPDAPPRGPDLNVGPSSVPEMTYYRTPIPPGSYGNPAEMEQMSRVPRAEPWVAPVPPGSYGNPAEMEQPNPAPRSELGVDRWESNIGGVGCG
jgi:hypothetical protein